VTDEQDEIARLLAAPLSGFVEERKRLAAVLKSLGRRDEAQAIAKLAKPSVAVWVVNQLAHAEIPSLKRLGEVSAAMRTAPRRARDDGDAASDYTRLLGEHRDLLRSLRAAAEKILAAAKLGASPAVLERIVHILRAGMADEETRARIETGRLLGDVAEPDFASLVGAGDGGDRGDDHADADADADGITGMAATSPSASAIPLSGRASVREEAAHARHLAAQATAQERARAHEAAAAARERARARADAERDVARLRTKADAARKQVASEERTVASLRLALIDGEQRLAHARQEADEISQSLATAEEKARSLPKA
jgi:hypothetical protein